MSNKYLKLVSVIIAASAAFINAQSHAANITIDDFSVTQPTVYSLSGPSNSSIIATTGFWSKRGLTIDSNTGIGASVEIADGHLTINTGPSSAAMSSLVWELNLANLQVALAQATFFSITLEQVGLDVGNVVVSPGSVVRTVADNGLTINLFSGNSVTSITNPFTVSFNSSTASDSQWRNLAVRFTCVVGATGLTTANLANDGCAIPVPGSAPLLALGFMGLVAIGARRRANSI
jgi:hypothetical protein